MKNLDELFKNEGWKLTAFEGQINIFDSIKNQYYEKGSISKRQENVVRDIIEQNENFSRMWRSTRVAHLGY